MATFATLDIANLTAAFHATSDDAAHTADQRDRYLATCAEDLHDLTGSVMVAFYNATAAELDDNITPVNKFSNKETGAKRLWANLVDLGELYAKRHAEAIAANKSKPRAPRTGGVTGVNLKPLDRVLACRAGTKQAILVDLLSRPQGATMVELMDAMSGGNKPWQEVTVKSGLNWDMNKVKGYGIRTSQRDGVDCYHLTFPDGMTAPLPHTPRKG